MRRLMLACGVAMAWQPGSAFSMGAGKLAVSPSSSSASLSASSSLLLDASTMAPTSLRGMMTPQVRTADEHMGSIAPWHGTSSAMLCVLAAVVAVGAAKARAPRRTSRTTRHAVVTQKWDLPPEVVDENEQPRPLAEVSKNLTHVAKKYGNTHKWMQRRFMQSNGYVQDSWRNHYESLPTSKFWNMYRSHEEHRKVNPWFPAPAASWMDLCTPKIKKEMQEGKAKWKVDREAELKRKERRGKSKRWKQKNRLATAQEAFATEGTPASSGFAGFSTGANVTGGTFAGATLPAVTSMRSGSGLGRNSTRASATMMQAHKKAAASTKNQAGGSNLHYWGITPNGKHGTVVKTGTLLAKQKGARWKAGANCQIQGNYDIIALKDGIVQWRGAPLYRKLGGIRRLNQGVQEVFVVPWEFATKHCVMGPGRFLLPKKYEPWMGIRNASDDPNRWHEKYKESYIESLRLAWLETDEGKEWEEQKKAKVEKKREYMRKYMAIREFKKQKLIEKKTGQVKEKVGVESGSDSES